MTLEFVESTDLPDQYFPFFPFSPPPPYLKGILILFGAVLCLKKIFNILVLVASDGQLT